jgi:hypothetical protein
MREPTAYRPGKAGVGRAALLGLLAALSAAHFLPAAGPNEAAPTFPRHVLIVRHAEKPEEKSVHLSAQGRQRAEALPWLFEATARRKDPFPKPGFLFATRDTGNSHRPVETLEPLSGKLKLPINHKFRNDVKGTDEKPGIPGLCRELFGNKKYQGKTVLVCWHHGKIPDLAGALGATCYPKKFKGEAFDRVWQITYDAKGKTTFADRPQRLLWGDSAE